MGVDRNFTIIRISSDTINTNGDYMSISNYLDSVAKPFQVLAPWILRLALGVSFILHGYGKFPLPPERMVQMFESGGMPAPDVVASMVALGEVGAGAAIILGGVLGNSGHLITRLGGGAVVVIMIGALYLAHSAWFVDFLTPFVDGDIEVCSNLKSRPGYMHFIYSEQMYLLFLGLYFAIKVNN